MPQPLDRFYQNLIPWGHMNLLVEVMPRYPSPTHIKDNNDRMSLKEEPGNESCIQDYGTAG